MMHSGSGSTDTLLGLNPGDIGVSECVHPKTKEPQARLQKINHLKAFLIVEPVLVPCGEKGACKYKGAKIKFNFEFKVHTEPYCNTKHFIRIGLKSGKLQFNFEGMSGETPEPHRKIEPDIKLHKEQSDSKEYSAKPKFGREKTRRTSETFTQVSKGGNQKTPYWFFHALEDPFLEGTVSLGCRNIPEEKHRCGGRYYFVLDGGSWSYKVYPEPKGLRKIITRLVLIEECKEIINNIQRELKENHHGNPSRGGWKCYARKL